MAGAGDDASPRPNFDKSPEIPDGEKRVGVTTNVPGEIKQSNKSGEKQK